MTLTYGETRPGPSPRKVSQALTASEDRTWAVGACLIVARPVPAGPGNCGPGPGSARAGADPGWCG